MADDKAKVAQLKDQGNAALKTGDLQKAVELYTDAILLDPANHVLYSNRSAAFAQDKQFAKALADGKKCVELKPDWAKGYSRLGTALSFLRRYTEAEKAFLEGLKSEPNNAQLQAGLEEVQSKLAGEMPSLSNPFAVPDLYVRLAANPQTKAYLDQPDYLEMIESLRRNPQLLTSKLQDPRVMQTIGVLLGIPTQDDDDVWLPPKQKKKAETKEEPMETQEPEVPENVKKSLEEKDFGNAAYKKKEFETALEHYDKAIELCPDNITFYTNKAAVYFEQGNFGDCILTCEKAVEVGRENRASYERISKALSRIGNAYYKQSKLQEALKYFEKSLAEHRSADILTKTQAVRKELKEQERLSYLDVDKSLEAKEKGNSLFINGHFPDALKCYTEAIKRNPEDAKLFSNRAACYQKLAAFDLALKDCEECIKREPGFVKGYSRKGAVLFAIKRYTDASKAYQQALKIDPNNKEAKDGLQSVAMDQATQPKDPEEVKRRAMADPEVQEILTDPAMRIILEQMQENPQAVQSHLKNPEILRKIQKLYEVGILQIR